MPSINVHYFASFREKAGLETEEFSTEFKSYADLYEALDKKYQFNLPAKMVQVAVNDEFASMKDQVVANAKVVFIPPVAGG